MSRFWVFAGGVLVPPMPVAKGANMRMAFSNHSMLERASVSKFASAGFASKAFATWSRIDS